MRRCDDLEASGEGGRVGQVDLVDRPRGLHEVDVRITEGGQHDLVRRQCESSRRRAGQRVDIASGAGGDNPTPGDTDRLDPAEPGLAGKRRDPPFHE